jgi:hypothetical protein
MSAPPPAHLMMQQRTELAIALQNEAGPANLGHACQGGGR